MRTGISHLLLFLALIRPTNHEKFTAKSHFSTVDQAQSGAREAATKNDESVKLIHLRFVFYLLPDMTEKT